MPLQVNHLIGFGASAGASSANGAVLDAIVNRGLTSGLKLVLDAGVSASYPGTGTVWFDISGNGYDFNFAASANDPAFEGVAGANTAGERMLYDGNDWHAYDSAIETWMSNLHKNGAVFSYIAGVTGVANFHPINTTSAAGNSGIHVISATGASKHSLSVFGDAGGAVLSLTSSATPDAGVWNFLGCSLDESSATSGVMKVNETTDTGLTVTYATPGTAGGTGPRLGATNAGGTQTAGSRMAFLCFWEGVAIGATALDNLYADIAAARAYGF